MKKINMERRFLSKLAAIVVGLILWVIIINVEDADFSARLSDVPVQLSGELALENNDLIVSNKGELEDASITVRGTRNDIIHYMDGIYALADVSKITEPGIYDLKVSYELSTSTLYIAEKKTTSVKVVVEQMQHKEVEVLTIQEGASQDTGSIIESVPSVKRVEVSGTAKDIEKVQYAAAYVDIRELSVDSEQSEPLVVIDSQYKKLDFKNNLYISRDEVTVRNKVYKRLTVPVKVEVKSGEEKAFVIQKQSFDKLDIGVSEGAQISEIKAVLEYEEGKGTQYRVKLDGIEGVYIPREYGEVEVTIKTAPRVRKRLSVPLIVTAGTEKSFDAPEQIEIELTGAEEEMVAGNITAEVDIRNYGRGVHEIPVTVRFKKTSLALAQVPVVMVSID